jgi:hypothetical protein
MEVTRTVLSQLRITCSLLLLPAETGSLWCLCSGVILEGSVRPKIWFSRTHHWTGRFRSEDHHGERVDCQNNIDACTRTAASLSPRRQLPALNVFLFQHPKVIAFLPLSCPILPCCLCPSQNRDRSIEIIVLVGCMD